MNTFFINIVFTVFTLFILIKIIVYSLYEIKIENNTFGGISTMILTFISVIFVNIMVWIN